MILSDLCTAYTGKVVSGDVCKRLCYRREWNVLEFHEGNKIVIILKDGGQEVILKSEHASIDDFERLDPRVNESDFIDAVTSFIDET